MALQAAWTEAAEGRLPANEQAKLWALREVLGKLGESTTQYDWMSKQVHVIGKGGAKGDHPGRAAVKKFFDRVDLVGPNWYPGVQQTPRTGRPVELTSNKRAIISRSMMAAKKRGLLPGYDLALALCPLAAMNDSTHEPFSRQTINDLLKSDCYDDDPEHPWEFRFGARRRVLTKEARDERLAWAERLLRLVLRPVWFHRNVLWIDLCSSVLPGNPKKALDQQQAGYNKRKRLMSPGAAASSVNMGGSDTAEKQCSFGDTRVYWGVVLARGVLGATVFTHAAGQDAYPGETPEGMRQFVSRLPEMLDQMLGHETAKPRTIFSDRGPGFYHRALGTITGEYETACREHNFRPLAGNNSKQGPHAQPPDIADVLLHETAIAWMRPLLFKTRPSKPWEETPQQFATRIHDAVAYVNANYEVSRLCKEFPDRLMALATETHGDRLPK